MNLKTPSKKGVVLKFLLLDKAAVRNQPSDARLDLRFLNIPDAHRRLAHDLEEAEAKLTLLRDNSLKSTPRPPGSLLVYRTDVLVQSSVIIHKPAQEGPIRVTYDLSFGDRPSDKFIQCYEDIRPDSFCSHLHAFYKKMFDHTISTPAHELTYDPLEPVPSKTEVERIAAKNITKIISARREAEAIRENGLSRILPLALGTFKSLRSGEPPPPPLSVQIELTNKCSTSCKHCFRFEKKGLQAPEIDSIRAKQLLTELKNFGVRTITISGGEPTQHSRFTEILHHAKQQGLAVGVLSNGVGLTDQVVESIVDHADWLRLSIDGSTAEVYGKVRNSLSGDNAFDEVQRTIDRFFVRCGSKPPCKLAVCYTIQRQNADDVPNMIRWARDRLPCGDKSLTFKFAHGENGFLCLPDQVKFLFEQVFQSTEFAGAANLDYLRWFVDQQSSVGDISKGRPTEGLYLRQATRCFTPHLFALVNPVGDVFPCCFLFEDNGGYSAEIEAKRLGHRIGNVFNDSFKDIWTGKRYGRVRDELEVIDPTIEKYKACGECTRHCNHNTWLSNLYEEYTHVWDEGGDGDAVMTRIVGKASADGIWL